MNGDLYLLGGSAAYASVVEQFVIAAGETDARIAVLLLGGSPKSVQYLAGYRDPLLECGASLVLPVMRGEDGTLDPDEALRRLGEATGIFIGGGHTPTYLELYGSGVIRDAIQDRSDSGIPIGGVSAGALMLPQVCAIPPEDTGEDEVTIAEGLGLVQGLVAGVHFSEWGALHHVLEAMATTKTEWALGLDEGGCAILRDGEMHTTLGSGVHAVKMRDFHTREYSAVRVA